MSKRNGTAEQTVVVVGGNGGMSDRYREVTAKHGLTLQHFEKKVPPGARHGGSRVGLVVIMVNMVSHALRDAALALAADGAAVVYLRSNSVSALRMAVEQFAA